MFFPGETISHKFIIPFNVNEISYAILSYKQNGAIIFEPTITSGFQEEDEGLTVFEREFTQEESILFEDDSPFTVQCNVYTVSGSRHTSFEMSSESGTQYYRELMSGVPFKILSQPVDCNVEEYGDTATFGIEVQSCIKYQWQYSPDGLRWDNAHDGQSKVFHTVATEYAVATYR